MKKPDKERKEIEDIQQWNINGGKGTQGSATSMSFKDEGKTPGQRGDNQGFPESGCEKQREVWG